METRQRIQMFIEFFMGINFIIKILSFIALNIKQLHRISIRVLCGYSYRLSLKGNFSRAIYVADEILKLTKDINVLHRLSPIYRLQGNYKKGFELATNAEISRLNLKIDSQLDKLNLRIFSSEYFSPIGHTAMIDIFIKAQILGLLEDKRNIILGPLSKFANPTLIQYWDRHCPIIQNAKSINLINTFSYPIKEILSLVNCNDGRLLQLEEFAMEVQLRWESEKRENLLCLSQKHKNNGYEVLKSLGLPSGAWFCALHVREGGDKLRAIRNADINTYKLAIEEINNHGGWVIRMGDKSMKPFQPENLNVIDYVHSNFHSDWMDIFLLAEGRFLLGTGSGPGAIPICFGKSVAFTNWGPLGHRHWGKEDLYLPKIYIEKTTGRVLNAEERMAVSCAYYESAIALKNSNILALDNSPDEIKEVVIEMLDKINGHTKHTREQILRKERFAKLSVMHKVYPSDLANAFINRYSNF